MTEHDGAIEYDLLCLTGHELRDVGRSLSWSALASFITYLDEKSALSRELNDEYSVWTTQVKTNGILADIFDMLAQINANIIAIGERSKAKQTRPYPRPGMEDRRKDVKHYGSGALSKSELIKWFAEKRNKNGKHD